jgi:spermidine/putrescine transport system permease protein
MKRRRAIWIASVLPGSAWEALFVIVPMIGLLLISFLSHGENGLYALPFTIENYRQLAGYSAFGFEPVYPLILARSIGIAAATSLICAVAALPLAFLIVSLRGRWSLLALLLLTIPVWTNLLVRTYAWQMLLGPDGWISNIASLWRLIPPGEALYPSVPAVLAGMVCDFLPFAALPLYACVEKMDRALIEAARDLGAGPWPVFRHAILPQIKPGLSAGVIFVFLPALGQFVVPDLLGGAKTVLIGNLLQQQFGPSRDWPLGAAIASVTMLCVVLAILFFRYVGKGEDLV